MKKIFSFVMCAAILFAAASCTDLLDESLRSKGAIRTQPSELTEGARLTLGFNVPMPIETKAMTEEPTISTMHVFVFIDNGINDNGVLLEVQPARLSGYVNANAEKDTQGNITNPDANTIMIARWEADLLMGRGKRRLHFVANLPSDFAIPDAGTAEFTVMRSIQTTGGDVAYWQMKELENGVLAYTYDGTGGFAYVGTDGTRDTVAVTDVSGYVNGSYNSSNGSYQYKDADNNVIDVAKGDYINQTGQKVLDGKGFYASCAVSNAVSQIALIRNFTRIKILTTSTSATASGATKFHLDSAVLINTPEFGFVAPFDEAHNRFVTDYRNSSVDHMPSHETIYNSGDGYSAPVPLNSIITTCPADSDKQKAGHQTVDGYTRDSVILYMYERGIPTSNATAVLVCGRMGNQSTRRWFKIEISDEDGAFYPFYRDFTYEVEIKSIAGSNGYDTMKEAWEGLVVGDISNSPETENLTRIDAHDLTLWVEYIEKTSVSPDSTAVTLLYKFYGSDNYTSTITPEVIDVSGREPAVKRVVSTATYNGNGPDGQTGWYQATVMLYGSSNETKVSTLRISGTHNNVTLHRDVKYHVMSKQDLTISATNLATEDQGESTVLSITLPRYLGYSIFPLTLKIESAKNNLNPSDEENLSVESGESIIPNSNNNSFYFLKTINFSDYIDKEDPTGRTYQVELITTRTGSTSNTNGTTIYVTDKVGYFNTANTSITVGGPIFRATNVSVDAAQTTATFSIISTGDNNAWTITPNSNDITISDVETKASTGAAAGEAVNGSGNADITVTLPSANETTEDNYYYLTATRTGFPNVTIKITQKGKVVSVSREIDTKSGTFNNDYAYTGDWASEVQISFDRGNAQMDNYIELKRNSNYSGTKPSVTITANKISQVVITWMTNYSVAQDDTSSDAGGTISYSSSTSTTTWTNNDGSNTVTLSFNVPSNANRPRIQKIKVTYLPE